MAATHRFVFNISYPCIHQLICKKGGGGDHRYNLSFIVQNGVDIGKPFIGVSTNYRLSAWGFLNGDAVQESGNTNLGLRDQRLALHWLQENIAAFGGTSFRHLHLFFASLINF